MSCEPAARGWALDESHMPPVAVGERGSVSQDRSSALTPSTDRVYRPVPGRRYQRHHRRSAPRGNASTPFETSSIPATSTQVTCARRTSRSTRGEPPADAGGSPRASCSLIRERLCADWTRPFAALRREPDIRPQTSLRYDERDGRVAKELPVQQRASADGGGRVPGRPVSAPSATPRAHTAQAMAGSP